ncbi:MAG: hypothetical protein IJP90_05315 [Treponema sp.]|nr:hypothetical protein [Treponema sp.]
MKKNFSEDDFSNMPDDSEAFVESVFSTISDAEWKKFEELQKNPPEFVRSMQATFNPKSDHSNDYDHVVNLYDRIEHEDIIFLMEYCGNFSEAEMVA